MSKVNDLIQKLCPNGVKFDKLENITLLQAGDRITTAMMSDDYDFDVIGGGTLPTGKYNNYNREHCVTISRAGSAGFVNWKENKFWATDVCFTASKNNDYMDIKFVYYYLKNAQKDLQQHLYGGSMPKLEKNYLWKYPIPIPPLEVQNEIVRILDKFGELEAELEARKSQYEFWSGKIFESHMGGETKHITDIALVKARVGWQRLTTAEYLNTGDYYLITGTDFTPEGKIDFNNCVYVTKERYEMDENIQVHQNDILITKDGTLGKIAYLEKEPDKLTTLNSGVFRIKIIDENVLPRYIYHYFNSKVFKDFIEKVKTGSTIPHLTQEKLVGLNIPIPNIEEQKKIINILDKFSNLTRSLSIGLPAEIELRRKQYEYYRNKLLSFEELSVSE